MPSNITTRNTLRSPEGFTITSEIDCGHGISTLAADGCVEVEIIAFSKNARYLCVALSAEKDCDARLRIVPDRQYTRGFERFNGWLWLKGESDTKWRRLHSEELHIQRSHMTAHLRLKAGERVVLTSETPLPYPQTCDFLQKLDGTHGFSLRQIGQSVQERPIYCLERITDEAAASADSTVKPLILIIAGEHATEFAGEFVARGMLGAVLEDSEQDEYLRQNFNWGFILNANPDGNINGWHQYNVNDWKKHAYPFPEDISWHHEYGPYLLDPQTPVSPETRAVADWVLTKRPAFIFNHHSWEGHEGGPGAFRANESVESYPKLIGTLDAIATKIANSFGVGYLEANSGSLASGHLGDTLASVCQIPSLTPEAHMSLGEENLLHFGAQWLRLSLGDPATVRTLQGIARQSEELYNRLPATATVQSAKATAMK